MTNNPHYSLLSLDLGRSTGWALSTNGVIVDSGVETFDYKSDDGHAGEGRRFVNFYNWLRDMLVHQEVDEVAYEYVTGWQKSIGATALYFGLLSQVKIATQNIPLVPIQTGTLKAAFTGSGRAKKEAMCARAIELGWGHGLLGTDQNHDEADAVALTFVLREKRKRDCRFATEKERELWLTNQLNNGI